MTRLVKLGILMLSLGAIAIAGPVSTAQACNAPACFASPGCCANRDCDSFCGGRGLGFCGASQCCTCQG